MIEYTKFLERGQEIVGGNVNPPSRARIKVQAEELSKAGDLKAHAGVGEAALMKAITIIYEPDTDGLPANFDVYTGQIWISLPWTKTGWKLYGLRDWEAEALRWILLQRLARGGIEPLFDYSSLARRWSLRNDIYPSKESAVGWLKSDPLTMKEWRLALKRFQDRQARYRRR